MKSCLWGNHFCLRVENDIISVCFISTRILLRVIQKQLKKSFWKSKFIWANCVYFVSRHNVMFSRAQFETWTAYCCGSNRTFRSEPTYIHWQCGKCWDDFSLLLISISNTEGCDVWWLSRLMWLHYEEDVAKLSANWWIISTIPTNVVNRFHFYSFLSCATRVSITMTSAGTIQRVSSKFLRVETLNFFNFKRQRNKVGGLRRMCTF